MEDMLDNLLYNPELSLLNESNQRKVMASDEVEDGWDVFENGDSMTPILSHSDIYKIMDCFEFNK